VCRWRGSECACRSSWGTATGDGQEESALTHGVTVGGRDGCHHGGLDGAEGAGGDVGCDWDGASISPVLVVDCEGWGGSGGECVWWVEDLDSVFFWVNTVLRIGSRDEDTSVWEEDSFGVVETSDDGSGHDGHALVDWLGWVIEDGIVVGVLGETESSDTFLCSVEDQVGSVGKGADAR